MFSHPTTDRPVPLNCWEFPICRKVPLSMRDGRSSVSSDSAHSAARPRSPSTKFPILIWRAAWFPCSQARITSLLGLPASYSQTSPTVAYNRNWIYNFFIQDDYRVLPNLTLNLGLRYEYGTPIYEKYNHLDNYEIATGTLVQASSSDRSLVNPDLKNFAPRIGLAWTAMPKLVVRSAYGMFYQTYFPPGAREPSGRESPFLHDLTPSQGPGAPPFVTLDAGPPANFFATALPTDQAVRGNDPNLKSGNVQQWNLTLQYALAKNWLFEVGYVANRGTHLSRFWNANQPNVAGPSGTLAARRPNAGFGDVEYMDSGGGSLYPQDAYNFADEKALAENIIKITSVASWVYELPFGHGRKLMASAPPRVEALLGGWQMDGIWTWRSGLPLTIASPACANCQMGGDRSIRGYVVLGVSPSLSGPNVLEWFNPAAFVLQTTPYGTVGRGDESKQLQ